MFEFLKGRIEIKLLVSASLSFVCLSAIKVKFPVIQVRP